MSTGRPARRIGTWGTITSEKRERGGKTYWRARVRVRDVDGVTRQMEATAASKGKAEDALNEKLNEKFRIPTAQIARDTQVMGLAHLWLDQLAERGMAPRTIQDYTYAVRRYVEPHFTEVWLSECTVLMVESVLRRVHRENGPGAAKTLRAVLMQILQIPVRHGGLASNPVRDAEMPRAQPVRQPRSLTRLEEDKLRRTLEDPKWAHHYDLREPILMALATGVRLGELCGFRWMDFDADRGSIAVEGTVQRITGRGILRKPTTKTRAGMRTLILPPWAVTMVKARRARFIETFGREPEMEEPLFTSPTGSIMDPANTQRLLRRLFKDAGLEGVTSHTFRKTVATRLDEAGLSAREVADQLGHSQITETLNRYMGRRAVADKASQIL